MTLNTFDFQELFDDHGKPLGALLGPEAWEFVRESVRARFGAKQHAPSIEEPLQDWQALVAFWDFKYPVDLDVACSVCGNETQDWSADVPRKFVLSAANLGGLVAFRCQGCQTKILKRHFKDVIKVEVRPFTEK